MRGEYFMSLADGQGHETSSGAKAHDASGVDADAGHPRGAMQDELITMKREIDALQIQLAETNKPWHRQAATMIAIVALLFSFGTTYYSNRQAHLQKIHNSKVELRELIQEIEAASLENVDIRQKYKDDPQALSLATSLVRTRQIVLATQAGDIIDTIPDDATATEYYAVASALTALASGDRILGYYQRGLAKADNIDSYSAIARAMGQYYLSIGDYAHGRSAFTQALAAFDRFSELSETYRRQYNAYTYMMWAGAELSSKNCPEAKMEHENAQREYQRLNSEGVDTSTWVTNQLIPQEQLLRKQCP
jgi:tetratricopeptide (TPR) repeat protein